MTFLMMLIQWMSVIPGNIYPNRNRDFVWQVVRAMTDAQWNRVFNLEV